MRVLCLSAYDAGSHRRWHEGLAARLGADTFTTLSLPPRYFRWRIRGNSLYWAHEWRELLEQSWDVVLATSMVDLSALRGFVPSLADALNVVYFHENQFAYPTSSGQHEDITPAVVNLYSALCADRVAFNSRYNLESFLAGTRDFASRMPDYVPEGLADAVEGRSRVLPVPLAPACFAEHDAPSPSRPLSIVWNHRWEYDKAPSRFFDALDRLHQRGLDFELHVLGERFRSYPKVFDRAHEALADHIATWGYVESADDYRAILRRADLVVSTSLHEFQGLAMLEAIAAGCRPLAPDRLAYREYVPEAWRYESFVDDADREVAVLAGRLAEFAEDPQRVRDSDAIDVSRYSWDALSDAYQELLEA
ncbi:DUF3524 domain-containing protein [Persicimonas caeni]|uniref:tRNA-queuosine alpha-mannosyltransferase n=1 Tax=Persicimonas caeni TaxID=2292766 RepID=A0A4Y6PXS7_PERCE|nr:DUF3524 domain-containing protein [Persicimonas caeni]QDG53138.1 DUF3524 domain-containing protein [Persicimonas caeni]QED34360.1 DUF3524 domain-containing protein [Persicimonas caeni]